MAHAEICIIKKCPRKTFGRLRDAQNDVRRDLCQGHLDSTLRYFNKKSLKVFIVDIWGEEVEVDELRVSYTPVEISNNSDNVMDSTSGSNIITDKSVLPS